MRFNNNKEEVLVDDLGTAESFGACLEVIAELLIRPMDSKLSLDDKVILGAVRAHLKLIADKAISYEELYEQGKLHQNYRN
tara:strand:+ start:15217 stop:15459 length:243 start_codon:yes stop_codon:yes gene_type:complete